MANYEGFKSRRTVQFVRHHDDDGDAGGDFSVDSHGAAGSAYSR